MVEDGAGEVTAQDLQFRGGAVRAVGRQFGDRPALSVHEDRAGLGGVQRLHRVEEPHPVEDLPRDTADVDVLPAVTEGRCALEDRDLPADAAQPVGGREAGDARAGDHRV
ncbi:hypothetical protein [Streptomyces sp. 8P21H-1]|uniref:hypothetical protein n=1 Tax=Streptomyces sp. 8P21H-1 TaxID=2737048 RepID=UPI0020C71FDA|nr:hypothetical protein [Streptomyces sp. 8P21H-1]